MAFIRDSDPKMHPPITLKDDNGTVRFPPPKPMPPAKLDPKIIKNVQALPIKQPKIKDNPLKS